MPTAEDRLVRTAEELNRAVESRPVPPWSPSSAPALDVADPDRRGKGTPPYVWLAAMVVLVAGLVALALTVAGGENVDAPVVDPSPPSVGDGGVRSIPMLDGSRLEVDLPDALAGLEVAYLQVGLTTDSSRTQMTVLPMSFEEWRTALAPPGTSDSDPPLVAGERLTSTARLFEGHLGDGVEGTVLVFDGGGAVGYVRVERAGVVSLPRSEVEELARSVAVVGGTDAPWVLVHPPTSLDVPSVTLRATGGEEMVLSRSDCDPAQEDRPGLVVRCLQEAGVLATLSGARASLLDELAVSSIAPAGVDGGESPMFHFAPGEAWQRSAPGESAKDLAERAMAEVIGDPAIAMSATSFAGNRPVVTMQTQSRAVVEAELAHLGGGFQLLRLSSPGLRRLADSTFVADVAGTLTVAGAPLPGGPPLDQEVFVDGVPITPGEVVGPFSFPESSWIEATLTTADGRVLHLFEAR